MTGGPRAARRATAAAGPIVLLVLLALLLGACTTSPPPAPAPSAPEPSRSTSQPPSPAPVARPPLALQHAAYLALPFTTLVSGDHADSAGRVLTTGTTIRMHQSLQGGEIWCAIASTTTGRPESLAFVRTSLREAAGGGLSYGWFWVTHPADCATAATHVLVVTRTMTPDPRTGVLAGPSTLSDVLDARADVDRFLTGHSPTQDLTTLGIQVYEAVLEVGPSGY
ncbi:MAG: hypothetical protein ACHQE5_13750 [Actinomycetes bacterium]